MDSEFLPEGRLLDIIDEAWRKDKLPHDDIAVPQVSSVVMVVGPFQSVLDICKCSVLKVTKNPLRIVFKFD